MKCFIMPCFLLIGLLFNLASPGQQSVQVFNKVAFYKLMANGSSLEIDKQLEILHSSSFVGKEAFEGALLMKQSGLASGAKKKLNLFKEGHKLLESQIEKDSLNSEFRFLRLMVQEHAPAIVGYKRNMEGDSHFIRINYRKLPLSVQQAIIEYSKHSRVLILDNHNE